MAKAQVRTSDLSRRNQTNVQLRNELLLRIPRNERASIWPNLEFVRLKGHQVLHQAGEPLKSGYFCNSGVFSVLSEMPNGNVVEVALIGKEGFAGIPLVSGFHTSAATVIVQVEATAFRVDASHLKAMFRQSPSLEYELHRYSQLLTLQIMQTSTCNRFCEVHRRLARWLLMTHDRCEDGSSFPITQDFLAYMLGTRRSSISLAAGILQKKKMISYARGEVTILNRSTLENAACDCYEALREQIRDWQGN
jgi:CRP-like cAMP-binding protein